MSTQGTTSVQRILDESGEEESFLGAAIDPVAERMAILQTAYPTLKASDRSEADLMATLGITFAGNAFHLGGYRYDRLQDAMNYAQLRKEGIAS